MRNLYCIVGPSGSGKTTIVNGMENLYGYKTVRSYTNRPPRHDDDTDHSYISQSVFGGWEDIEKVFKNIVAWVDYNGYQYFVTEDQLNESDLYVIDPEGLKTLKATYTNKPIKVIFVDCPPETCYNRMLARGDAENDAWRRACMDIDWFNLDEELIDFAIKNVSSIESVEKIHEYIEEEENG